MGRSRWIHLDDVDVLRESESGLAFEIEIEEGKFWIPKSQISDPENYEVGDQGASMSISEWIAEEKGIA